MKPKKKILYVITKSNWGGAQRYVFDLAKNLPLDQYETVVVTGGKGLLVEKLGQAGIRTVSLPTLQESNNFFSVVFSPINILALLRLISILRKEKPDTVHLNSSKAGGLGALAARLTGVPKIIFTAHGWGFLEERPRWQESPLRFLSWLAARFQDHIIHVSRADLNAAISAGITEPENSWFIPLGIASPNFLSRAMAQKMLSKKIGAPLQGRVIIGTIAELTKNKGLTHLLDAVKQVKLQIPNYKFQTLIVGDGEEREKLQKQIRSLGLQDTIHLAGFIPDAAKYLKAFDAFVLPSLKEGLPYTILEALHAGLPVVATNVGGIPDIIEQEKNGIIVPSKDSTALAEAIIYLFAHPDTCKYFAKGAAKKIGVYCSLNNMVEKTCALYES